MSCQVKGWKVRDATEDQEKMMNGMVHWHGRLSVSEIIVITVCRIEVCGQMIGLDYTKK